MADSSLFERTPLVMRSTLPLRAGQLRARNLPAIPRDPIPVVCIEGAVRIASFMGEQETSQRVNARLAELLAMQQDDGSWPFSRNEALCVARASWQAYLWQGDRRCLAAVNTFLAWVATNYDSLITDPDLQRHPADLIELAVDFYRHTGTPGSLRLLAKLRRDAWDWSVRLRTFDQTRPVDPDDKTLTDELKETLRADSLADGLRGVQKMSEYSGNGTEAQTGELAWPKIRRWHGAICGGVTGSPLLGGASSAAPIDPEVFGTWAEVISACAASGEIWAAEEAEKLYVNTMPVASAGYVFSVNQLPAEGNEKSKKPSDLCTGRLLRGISALLASSLLRLPNGFRLLYAAPITCGLNINGHRVTIAVREEKNAWVLKMQPDAPLEFTAEIRVPAWADNAKVTISGGTTVPCEAGKVFSRKQTWNPGDEIRLDFDPVLQVVSARHQGRCVYVGPRLMALPLPADHWAYALESAWIENGEVKARMHPVREWKLRDGQPVDVPVLPETEEKTVECVFVPFAETKARIALFAGCDL